MLEQARRQIGSLGILAGWTEKRFALRTSRAVLEIYRREHSAHPELSGRELYVKVVAAFMGSDLKAASSIVRQAGESFADWPSWRDTTFRDVVNYVVIARYRQAYPGRDVRTPHMGRVVAKTIPGDL